MRVPPGGSIPRGVVIETAVITEGIAEGPEILPSPGEIPDDFPMPLTGEFLELGRKHYEITCAVCHGLAGNAASTVATKMTLRPPPSLQDRKSTRLNSSHVAISYAVICLKKTKPQP